MGRSAEKVIISYLHFYMAKNITIVILLALVIGLGTYIIVKEGNWQASKNPSIEQPVVSMPVGAKKISESPDGKYSLFTYTYVNNRLDVLQDKYNRGELQNSSPKAFPEFFPVGFGDSLYLKENATDKIVEIYADKTVFDTEGVQSAVFTPDSQKLIYTTSKVYSYSISTSETKILSSDATIDGVAEIAPDGTTAILTSHEGQEGAGGSIVQLEPWTKLSTWYCYTDCSGPIAISFIRNDAVLSMLGNGDVPDDQIVDKVNITDLRGNLIKTLKTYHTYISVDINKEQSNSSVLVLDVGYMNAGVKMVDTLKINRQSLELQ